MTSRYYTTNDALDLRTVRTRRDQLRIEARQRRVEPARVAAKQHTTRQAKKHGALFFAAAARMGAIALFVASGAYGAGAVAPSLSYFMDTEGSPANALGSSALAIEAWDGGNVDLSCGTHAAFDVEVALDAPRSGAYSAHAIIASESDMALCEALTLKAYHEGTKVYGGTVDGLTTDSIEAGGSWQFTVNLGESIEDEAVPNGTVCTFDVIFSAYCPMLGYEGGGFTDDDAVTFTIAKNECDGPDCPCVSCGDVYIDIDSNTHNETTNIIDSNAGSGDVVIINGSASVGGDGGGSSVTTGGVNADSETDASAEGGDAESDSTTEANGEAASEGGDGGDAGDASSVTVVHTGGSVSEVTIDGGHSSTVIDIEADNCCCECEENADPCDTTCGSEWYSSWSHHETRSSTERSFSFDGTHTHAEETTSTETYEASGEEGGTSSGSDEGGDTTDSSVDDLE